MAKITSFKALRPSKEMVEIISSPPYDVVTREEVKDFIKNTPYSFFRLTRSEAELDDSISPYNPVVYSKAKKNLEKFIQKKVLQQDSREFLYIYSQSMKSHTQTGLVCCASVDEYLNQTIKKHEKTRTDKENDRIRHIDTLNAQLEPVFLTHPPENEIKAIIQSVTQNACPIYDFISNDQVSHKLWIIEDQETTQSLITHYQNIQGLYIADGHHRAASAAKVKLLRQNNNPTHTGNEPYNFFLSVIFSSDELQILPYNRVVTDIKNYTPDEFLSLLNHSFSLMPISDSNDKYPKTPHNLSMYLKGQWYSLQAKSHILQNDDIIKILDVSILQDHVLQKLLNIQDPRSDKRLDFIGGIHGVEKLEKLVDSGEMEIAFALYPTAIESLIKVADENKLMPPKSTWFEPKLRSGLFANLLN